MSEVTPFPIEILYPDEKLAVKFSNIDEAISHCRQLTQEINQLTGTGFFNNNLANSLLSQALQHGNHFKNNNHSNYLQILKTSLTQFYGANQWLGNSVIRKIIAEKAATNKIEASGILAAYLNIEVSHQMLTTHFIRGYFFGYAHVNGIKWTTKSYSDQLQNLSDQFTATHQQQENEFKELISTIDSNHESRQSISDELQKEYSSKMESNLNELNERIKQQDEKLKALCDSHEKSYEQQKKVFADHIALSRPVAYWTTKKVTHDKVYKKCLRVFSLALIFGLTCFSTFIYFNFQNAKIESLHDWRFISLMFFGFVFVWLTRLLVRTMLSNQHLATDAQERVTMVETYLSLSKEEKGLSSEERIIILSNLFRPASDGLVKDDGVPPSIVDLLTRK